MTRHIALLAYPDCQLLDVSGPWQVFASANALSPHPLYQLTLVADDVGPVATNGGLAVHATHTYRQLNHLVPLDTLLVAGGSGVMQQRDIAAVKEVLCGVAPEVRRLGSICSGAFLLAAAGLLDSCRVTTHWRHAQQLADEYPALSVEPDALYIESNGRYTSAGITAGIDLALSLVEADYGATLAGRVARELVVFLHRPGGQSQFSEALRHQQDAGSLRRLIDQLHADPAADYSLERMADVMAVTPRHLTRLFRRHLQITPGAYVTQLRLEQARLALLNERGQLSLERLAQRWRLGGAEQLRRQFQRYYGVSPSVYRQRFASSCADSPMEHLSCL
ncbi:MULTISPECIES: GlxA family transcriptional regulator [unclassified Halomonas]|uniref:GlxA family transcriptional regulator n=1 Tax=unclassified Halomonas TaxID=2609666 RepID=UPI0006DAE41B|nr:MULTISPECIES: helix-turn-helix domain-containing protein [unclassified Halomonas]KPQ22086.1 MAG: Transcriptional regulator containing an amidase domain and an AraC-type DNA-binding HTH domain [Halomonas sp. HL-93]SBR45945.1 transcriptional regulator, AraC family with amidase-like domain [Halomonas sp. HL-93]SNY98521.1 transcriptional regulator, AraC family with amidase-like domain [Halomonas sp. hl-4]